MREDEAIVARGRASEYTPYGDSNRSTSAGKPVKAIIFDIGDVVTKPKYGWTYKRVMRKLDGALSKVTDEDNPLRAAVIRQKRAYKLNNDVMALIQKLHANGYLTPSITNTSRKFSWDERLSDGSPFDGVVDSMKVGLSKPDMRIYELAMRRFKLQPEECVFVDDKEENLVPAREMGMRTVLFKNAKQLKEELRKLGVRVG
jgi:HAD superfamily hydrolase (TIGR01509 family)